MKATAKTGAAREGRIEASHLGRTAMVYLRQSSPAQVERNPESTRLQYGLKARVGLLGWPDSRIEVVDADLGMSGRGGIRSGYASILSEVAHGRVGLIIGYDLSRLSRDQGDWGVLVGLCTEYDTLIADVESVYNLNWPNDRLILGIRGTMAEAELHSMRLRMYEGLQAKAARGELSTFLPRGYARSPCGAAVLDPDAGVCAVVRHVFELFAELGSLSGALRALAAEGTMLPRRSHRLADRGRLLWGRPNSATLQNMLTNPVYGGAFAWGRIRGLGSGAPLEERWRHLVKDRYPAYISWEEFELNQRQLAENRWPVRGSRGGLLSGLLACGACGQSMRVNYRGSLGNLHYVCRGEQAYGGKRCQILAGSCIDGLVGRMVLSALAPAAFEISLQAAADVEAERERLHEQWRLRLQRAAEAAARAERSYRMVDPGNRIVAQTLEDEWEKALSELDRLEADCRKFQAALPRELSPGERDRIRAVAADIGGSWRDGALTNADKAAIVRLAVKRVHATVVDKSERVEVAVDWHGARRTCEETRRPVQTWSQLSNFEPLHRRAAALKAKATSLHDIARRLNSEGWTPARGDRFTAGSVKSLFSVGEDGKKIRGKTAKRRAPANRAPDEWLIDELSRETGIPKITLFNWVQRGWAAGRKEVPPAGGKQRRWLVHADAAALEAMREWRRKELWKKGAFLVQPDFRPGSRAMKQLFWVQND